MKKKVYIGFSGGVDSSVAAYILKQKGFDVTAVFMTVIPKSTYAGECMTEELENAKTVAKFLDIPLITIDLKESFEEKVRKPFYQEYMSGRTPNPCIECNRLIKFGELANECLKLGADFVSTGHYAKVKNGKLFKAKDQSKDQTYFLNRVSSEILSKTIFPLANMKKEKVREIAERIGLPNFDKKDSQKICFLKGVKIEELFNSKKGNIVDIDTKEIVGEHNGIYKYTIGQRQGVKIGGLKEPYFVAKKELDTNTLFVAKGRDNPYLWKDKFVVDDFNFIHKSNVLKTKRLKAVIRYHSKEVPASVHWNVKDDKYQGVFTLKKKLWAPSTGQSLVIYKGNECLGGGEISEIL